MKIGFFSEAGYEGTPPRSTENMRTDLAWVCALNAVHHPIQNTSLEVESFRELLKTL